MKQILLFFLVILLSIKIARAQTEVTFYTTEGNFVIETYDTLQPITTGNFLDLVNAEFYDGIIFHRIISDFVIQGGDPTGSGTGGPGYTIQDEFSPFTSNVRGTLSMANAGPNTGGSQFFINVVDNTFLDSAHPVFGNVTSDFSVIETIAFVPVNGNDRPITEVVMDSVRVTNSDTTVGTNDLLGPSLSFSISPNPADDQVSISIEDIRTSGNEFLLEITNLLGQKVHSEQLISQKTTIDVSTIITKGIYLMHVFDEQTNARAVKKFVLR